MKALLWSLTALVLQGVQPLAAQAALPSYRIDLLDAAPSGFTFGPASMNDRGAIAGLATGNSTLRQQPGSTAVAASSSWARWTAWAASATCAR
jgi:hypothetical protein